MKDASLFCPSVSDGASFETDTCKREACCWWDNGCTAQKTERERYAKVEKAPAPPPCPRAAGCRWHNDAAKLGLVCLPRSLGMICEHAGGIWNTFDMAEPEEW